MICARIIARAALLGVIAIQIDTDILAIHHAEIGLFSSTRVLLALAIHASFTGFSVASRAFVLAGIDIAFGTAILGVCERIAALTATRDLAVLT